MITALYWGLRAKDIAEPLIGGAVLVVGALLVAFTASRELSVKRRLESTDRFLDLVALAHARPRDSTRTVGVVEQVGAITLIAQFGEDNKWLKQSAIDVLHAMSWL